MPFRILLLLNHVKGNRISLLAPRLEAGCATEAVVDCAQPITAQRLYVLALSPHSQPDAVKERILNAIHARQAVRGSRSSTVAEVKVLTGSYVSPDYLRSPLYLFEERMRGDRRNAATGKGVLTNEVLLIYYEGREKIDDKGHFFETYTASGDSAFGMPCDRLVGNLASVPGAHVLLLDVDRPRSSEDERSRDKIERWKDSYPDAPSRIVVMRCARRGEPERRSPVRLIPVLEKYIPQATPLSKMIALIEEALLTSDDRELLVFTKHLPPELADLRIVSAP